MVINLSKSVGHSNSNACGSLLATQAGREGTSCFKLAILRTQRRKLLLNTFLRWQVRALYPFNLYIISLLLGLSHMNKTWRGRGSSVLTAKVQMSEIRDSGSRSTLPPNCCVTNSRLSGSVQAVMVACSFTHTEQQARSNIQGRYGHIMSNLNMLL